MRRLKVVVTCYAISLAAGCASNGGGVPKFTNTPLMLQLTGIVVTDTSAPPPYYLADHLEIFTEKADAVADLSADSWQESTQILRVRVIQQCEGTLFDYQAVIAPHAGERARWRVHSAEEGIELVSGAVWVWGIRPRAHTDWVTASSDSVMAGVGLDIVDSTSQHAFYVNGAYGARITCNPSTLGSREFTTAETYYVVPENCADTAPSAIPIPSTGPHRDRYARLRTIAETARWSP